MELSSKEEEKKQKRKKIERMESSEMRRKKKVTVILWIRIKGSDYILFVEICSAYSSDIFADLPKQKHQVLQRERMHRRKKE